MKKAAVFADQCTLIKFIIEVSILVAFFLER